MNVAIIRSSNRELDVCISYFGCIAQFNVLETETADNILPAEALAKIDVVLCSREVITSRQRPGIIGTLSDGANNGDGSLGSQGANKEAHRE